MRGRELENAKSELDRMVSENPEGITERKVSELTSRLPNGYHRIDFTNYVARMEGIPQEARERAHDIIETENRHNHKKSRTDDLTRLHNENGFYEKATQMLGDYIRVPNEDKTDENEEVYLAVYADLDGFKKVNDREGHDAGDDVLRLVGDVFRDRDLVYTEQPNHKDEDTRYLESAGRQHGDEFLALLRVPRGKMKTTIDSLKGRFDERFSNEGWKDVSISMGAAEVPRYTDTGDEIYPKPELENAYERAEKALYYAKARTDGTHLYNPGMEDNYKGVMKNNNGRDKESTGMVRDIGRKIASLYSRFFGSD